MTRQTQVTLKCSPANRRDRARLAHKVVRLLAINDRAWAELWIAPRGRGTPKPKLVASVSVPR